MGVCGIEINVGCVGMVWVCVICVGVWVWGGRGICRVCGDGGCVGVWVSVRGRGYMGCGVWLWGNVCVCRRWYLILR